MTGPAQRDAHQRQEAHAQHAAHHHCRRVVVWRRELDPGRKDQVDLEYRQACAAQLSLLFTDSKVPKEGMPPARHASLTSAGVLTEAQPKLVRRTLHAGTLPAASAAMQGRGRLSM